jgi:hypothetical protein
MAKHSFSIGNVKFQLVGVQFWNGHNHYMAILQDTDRRWWYFTGLSRIELAGSLNAAIQRVRDKWFDKGRMRIQPAYMFCVASG